MKIYTEDLVTPKQALIEIRSYYQKELHLCSSKITGANSDDINKKLEKLIKQYDEIIKTL